MSALLSFNKKHRNKDKDTNLLFNNNFPTLKLMFVTLGNMPQILKSTTCYADFILFLPRSRIRQIVTIFYTFQNENFTKAKKESAMSHCVYSKNETLCRRVSLITLTLQLTECKTLFSMFALPLLLH